MSGRDRAEFVLTSRNVSPNCYNIGLDQDEGCLCWNGERALSTTLSSLSSVTQLVTSGAPLLLFAARFPATHSLFIVQHSPVATEILMAVALPDSMAFPRPCIRVPWPPSLFIASLSLYFRCSVLLYLTIKYLYMSRHGSCSSWNFMICSRNCPWSVSVALENLVCPRNFTSV